LRRHNKLKSSRRGGQSVAWGEKEGMGRLLQRGEMRSTEESEEQRKGPERREEEAQGCG